jgi:hypothetical protein
MSRVREEIGTAGLRIRLGEPLDSQEKGSGQEEMAQEELADRDDGEENAGVYCWGFF